MSCTLQLEKIRFFYAIGNSPAVSLTDHLPRGQKADLLLLGCGDVRNILFTVFSESPYLDTDSPTISSLDFTCCDWEPAILARNVILFAVITRPDARDNSQLIWNLYYHIFLDNKSNSLLTDICEELYEASETMEMWHVSRVGAFLRMASSATLSEIRRYLALYLKTATATAADRQTERRRIDRVMRATFSERTKGGARPRFTAGGGGPLAAVLDQSQALIKLYEDYWASGVVSGMTSSGGAVAFPNPLLAFATGSEELGQEFPLHYGSEPCQGFHLAEGLATLGTNTTRLFVARCCAATAMKQFQRWWTSFRDTVEQQPGRVIIRFMLGHAASVCRILRNSAGADIPQYIDYWSPLELRLDGPGYAVATGTPAPRRFVVVDTSNLSDHFGMLNMLLLATPLLQSSSYASVTTETLKRYGTTTSSELASTISGLGADIQALAITLGIAPHAQQVGFTTHNSVHEAALTSKEEPGSVQTRERIAWTRTANLDMDIYPGSLAKMLYDVYLDMTAHEDWGLRRGAGQQQRYKIQHYTREGFAHFLVAVKLRFVSAQNWDTTMDVLMGLIEQRCRDSLLGMNSYQDLVLHLHLLEVHSIIPKYPEFVSTTPYHIDKVETVFRDWPSIPPVVYVTLLVPRSALAPIEDPTANSLGNPVLTANISGAGAANDFSSAHAVHGHFVRSGPSGSFDSEVRIIPATGSWSNSKSDIVLCFPVPSWILMLDPAGTTARLVLRAPPQLGTMSLMMRLGPDLTVFKASLSDHSRVAVTREAPHLQPSTSPLIEDAGITHSARNKLTVFCDGSSAVIKTLSLRVGIPVEYKEEWQKKLPVSVCQIAPCVLRIKSGTISLDAQFSCPVLGNMTQVKNARSSMYCQIDAPVGRCGVPPSINDVRGILHRVNLDLFPKIDFSNTRNNLVWLPQHMAHMFSDHDANLVKNDIVADASQPARCADQLVALKDVIRVVFVEAARMLCAIGSSKDEAIAFGEEGHGGYIIPQALRLELGAHTVILDALSIPWAADAQYVPLVARTIQLDNGATTVWRTFLAASIERTGRASASDSPPASFRAAIPLLFPVPFLESVGNTPRWLLRAVDYATPFPKAQPRKSLEAKVTSPGAVERACAQCHKVPAAASTLLQCGACKAVSYCDRTCQKAHWKVHKAQCRV